MSTSFPSTAQVVIIGGGVIGTSIAYHLTKLGWKAASRTAIWPSRARLIDSPRIRAASAGAVPTDPRKKPASGGRSSTAAGIDRPAPADPLASSTAGGERARGAGVRGPVDRYWM